MIFLFWDLLNDELELLGEDGNFYAYGEDSVAIARGSESGRYWLTLEKLTDVTPLNNPERFEIYDEREGGWVKCLSSSDETWQQVQKLAGVKDWQNVF